MNTKCIVSYEYYVCFFKHRRYRQKPNQSIKQQRESLPIFLFREAFLQSMREHQILIVIGEREIDIDRHRQTDRHRLKQTMAMTRNRNSLRMGIGSRI